MAKMAQEREYKRLKVGQACFVCRSKKIKCDGLKPCMQCKARGRNCVSSKPGSTAKTSRNNDIQELDDLQLNNKAILVSCTKPLHKRNKKPKHNNTSPLILDGANQLNTPLSFGKLIRWQEEPSLPEEYSSFIEMPSIEIQMQLISEYFDKIYPIIPIIPRRVFFRHLHTKGPLITPLLLNSMYCIVTNSIRIEHVPAASVFFDRARKLLDDFLDTPRISTAAALCILSLYQPLASQPKSAELDNNLCRSWIYSGMASRMCIELGLNVDTADSHANISDEDIELRRRLFWYCYCYDKIISVERERVWSMSASLPKVALPNVLPEDDIEEHLAVLVLREKSNLIIIGEKGLQIKASYYLHDNVSDQDLCNSVEKYIHQIHQWKENLSEIDSWQLRTSHSESPKRPIIVSQVLCIYHFMLCDAILCLPNQQERIQEGYKYATRMIQNIEDILDAPVVIIRSKFIANCIAMAVRVLSRSLKAYDTRLVKQSSCYFDKCVKLLDQLQTLTSIPQYSRILQSIYESGLSLSKSVPESLALPTVPTESADKSSSLLSVQATTDRQSHSPCPNAEPLKTTPLLQATQPMVWDSHANKFSTSLSHFSNQQQQQRTTQRLTSLCGTSISTEDTPKQEYLGQHSYSNLTTQQRIYMNQVSDPVTGTLHTDYPIYQWNTPYVCYSDVEDADAFINHIYSS